MYSTHKWFPTSIFLKKIVGYKKEIEILLYKKYFLFLHQELLKEKQIHYFCSEDCYWILTCEA